VERELAQASAVVGRGGDYDRWDLQVRGGPLANARLFLGIEGHAGGKQNLHFRIRFRPARPLFILSALAALIGVSAIQADSWLLAAACVNALFFLGRRAQADWHLAAGQLGVAIAALKARAPFFEDLSKPREKPEEWSADLADQMPAVDAAE
jgi:hypothetical protein